MARWTRRLVGLLATAAFLASGVAIAELVMPAKDKAASAPTPTPTATPSKHHKKKVAHKAKKKAVLTKAQKLARANAVSELRTQGYTPLNAAVYNPRKTLRVLIGRPVGDAGGGEYAFFFEGTTFLGKDASAPSTSIKVSKQGTNTATLTYGVYAPGDTAGQPSDHAKIRFALQAGAVHALDTIPAARFQRATG